MDLALILRSRLPLVGVTTNDTIYVLEVLTELAGKKVVAKKSVTTEVLSKTSFDYIATSTVSESLESLYRAAESSGKTIILINHEYDTPDIFEAGEVPTPKSLMLRYLSKVTNDAEELLPLFSGMTIKDMLTTAQVTLTRDQELGRRGVINTRRMVIGAMRGLTQVDTTMPFYQESTELRQWCDHHQDIFLHCPERRLVPRGLMFNGPPGTGKTQAAKFISGLWGVPLYHLEIGTMMAKWVGESEHNLQRVLGRIDKEDPCVLLIDEIEKVFTQNDESGVATRMMSQLLWWLQEHTSRVLTVMTTNDVTKLPPELYREGRVDQVMLFEGLRLEDSLEFATSVIHSLDIDVEVDIEDVNTLLEAEYALQPQLARLPHSKLTQVAYEAVKLVL